MGRQHAETRWVLGGLSAGAALAVAAVAAMLAGYMLVGVVVLGLFLAAPAAGVVVTARGVRAQARHGAPAPATVPQATPAAEVPVVARLVEMQGSCARRVQYAVGDEFTFQDGQRVSPALCGPALRGLLPYVGKLRAGENGRVATLRCPLSGSVLVFELRPGELVAAPGRP